MLSTAEDGCFEATDIQLVEETNIICTNPDMLYEVITPFYPHIFKEIYDVVPDIVDNAVDEAHLVLKTPAESGRFVLRPVARSSSTPTAALCASALERQALSAQKGLFRP